MPTTQICNLERLAPTDSYDSCDDGADGGEREQSGREDAAEAAERGGCCGSPRSLVSHVDHDRAEDERSVEERNITSRGQSCRARRRTSYHRWLHLCPEVIISISSLIRCRMSE